MHTHRALSLPPPVAFLLFAPCSGPPCGCWVSGTLHSAVTQPPWAMQRGEPKATGITGKQPEPRTRPKRSLTKAPAALATYSRFPWWTPQLQSWEGFFVLWDSSTSLCFKQLFSHLPVLYHWLLGSSSSLLLLPWTSQADPHLPWNLRPLTRCSTAADALLFNYKDLESCFFILM